MKLSIIIPTKDREGIFEQTLVAAYQAVNGVEAEIIVVNDSKNGQPPINPAFAERVSLHHNPKSGVASARNLGARLAKGDLLLFLDDDMLIVAADIQTTFALHGTLSNCCINLNWIYPPEAEQQLQQSAFGRYLIHYGFTSLKGWNRGNYWNEEAVFKTTGITSQYLSMTKADFERSGGYNESFPHAGFEDYEFAQRLQKCGIDFYIYPKSKILHNETDRLALEPWLQRRKRGGETRRVAAQLGYQEVAIQYPAVKKSVLSLLCSIQPALKNLLVLLPNQSWLDKLHFRLINTLLAVAIFEGYQQR